MRAKLIIIFLFLISSCHVKGQVQADSLLKSAEVLAYQLLHKNHDTTFIKGYEDEVAVRLLSTNRANSFRIVDLENDGAIRYRPNLSLSLGVGVSYKWFSVNFSFDTGLIDGEDFENDRSVSIVASVFSSKHYVSALYNYELGYRQAKFSNEDLDIPEDAKVRSDIRLMQFGFEYLYSINYGRFSFKAPFVNTQVQKKSAGSPVLGAAFLINSLDADTTMIPQSFVDEVSPDMNFTNLTSTHATLSAGYFYTLVFLKHWYFTVSAIPSLSLVFGDYQRDGIQLIDFNLQAALNSLNSFGYNGRRFFASSQLSWSVNPVRLHSDVRVDFTNVSLRIFAGYRFGGNKK